MYAGMIIEYHVSPLAGVNLHWVTEITHVEEPNYFVDEQRKGPYTLWHHRHFFKEVPGGVIMKDIVCYQLPMGIIGNWMNTLLVRKKVTAIFDHRKLVLEKIFGK
jgi:ligand-binding SRPBCC domain-containing protein